MLSLSGNLGQFMIYEAAAGPPMPKVIRHLIDALMNDGVVKERNIYGNIGPSPDGPGIQGEKQPLHCFYFDLSTTSFEEGVFTVRSQPPN